MYRFQCRKRLEIACGGCKSLLQHTICNHWMTLSYQETQCIIGTPVYGILYAGVSVKKPIQLFYSISLRHIHVLCSCLKKKWFPDACVQVKLRFYLYMYMCISVSYQDIGLKIWSVSIHVYHRRYPFRLLHVLGVIQTHAAYVFWFEA